MTWMFSYNYLNILVNVNESLTEHVNTIKKQANSFFSS